MSNSVNKNALYNTIKTIFGIIYPLITFPYISRVLTPENVGKINFGNSVVSYFMLIASLGVTTYAIRECSKVRDNKDELETIASQILSINVLSMIIAYLALAVTLIVARPLDNYRELICIQSTTIIFTTLGADWINSAMEDFKFIAIRTVGMQIVSLILMFIFVLNPDDYIIFAVISVVASSGANFINVIYRRKFCRTKFTIQINWKKHLPPILTLFSLILTQTIYCNSDIIILGLVKGDYEVGLYSISVKIYNLVNQVVASIAFVVMPQLAASFAKDDFKQINNLLRYALNYIIVLGFPCLVGINTICSSIIGTLGGSEYMTATTSLHILSLSLACSFIGGWIGNMMMLPSGRDKVCLKSGIISATINVISNIVLIPIYGLNAAAFTTFLAELIGIVYKWPYIDKRIKIINLYKMIKAPIVGSIFIVIIGSIVSRCFESYLLITGITIGISVVVYALILIIMKDEFFIGYMTPIIERVRRNK